MRHYWIYLMKEEIASEFFGNEQKLYELFREYHHPPNRKQQEICRQQIRYITKPISEKRIKEEINATVRDQERFSCADTHSDVYQLQMREGQARLMITKNHVRLLAKGKFEVEAICFERLRNVEKCFLAMDFHHHHYGWLRPIRPKCSVI